jgi:hypothetical protein
MYSVELWVFENYVLVAELKLDQIRVDVSKRVVGYDERISYTEDYKVLHYV